MKTIYKNGFVWVVFLFPVLFIIMLALSVTWRFPALIASGFSFKNLLLITDAGGNIAASMLLSFCISAFVSAVAVAAAFFISRRIAWHSKKNVLVFFAYLPFILSPVVYAACLNYFFVVTGLSGSIQGVLIAQFIIIFPYNIILFLSHWNTQLRSYEHITATLGGNRWQTYIKVLLPVSRNILLVAFFQSFLISWFEFGLTSFIGAGQVQTLTLKVYQYISEANIHLAAFSSMLLIIPPLILLWLNKRFVFHNY